METRENLLERLNRTILKLMDVSKTLEKPDLIVYEDWTVKDILGHILFWHESFARNVQDINTGIKPAPLKGSYRDLTQQCLQEMRAISLNEISQRLEAAHRIIMENILDPQLVMIPYKKGSRDYSPEEHLDIVDKHINEHLNDIRKAIIKT